MRSLSSALISAEAQRQELVFKNKCTGQGVSCVSPVSNEKVGEWRQRRGNIRVLGSQNQQQNQCLGRRQTVKNTYLINSIDLISAIDLLRKSALRYLEPMRSIAMLHVEFKMHVCMQ